MAVQYVDEIFSSGLSTDVDERGRISASASRKFNVFTTSAADTDLDVKFDPRLPVERSRHPLFPLLYCKSIQLDRKTPVHWEVQASYISAAYRDTSGPTNQPTEIETFTITSEEPIDEDVNGMPIATVNREPIYGITRPISDMGIRLSKRFRFFDQASFYTYIDCVNADTYLGFPPGVLRVTNISASDEWVDDVPYVNVQVEIHARKPYQTTPQKAWWKRVRHEGFYVKKNNKIQRATDEAGKPMVEPVMLKADGTELKNAVEAEWLEFQIFSTVSFASMGF